MPLERGADRVENRAEDILRRRQQRPFADRLAVRPELSVEAVHVNDEPEPPEGPVAELVRRDPEMAVDDVNKPAEHIHEKTVTPPQLFRLPREKVLVGFSVAGDAPEARHVEAKAVLARFRHSLVLRCRSLFRARLG